MRSRRAIACLVLLLSISACISTGARVSDTLKSTSAGDGWIVGTIGAETGNLWERKGSVYTDNKLIFARLDSQAGGGGTLTASAGTIGFGVGKSFSGDGEYSDLFAIQLPAGEYGFVGTYFWQNQGQYGTSQIKTGFPAPVRFTVRPGEVLYLGALIATNEWPAGYVLRSNPGNPYFTIYSRAGRDMPALRQANPGLPTNLKGWTPANTNPALRMPAPTIQKPALQLP